MHAKVFAVIVTFNPDLKRLMQNIALLKKQVARIVIVNNSNYSINCNNLKIIELGKNFGIAKAQNIGMEWSFAEGADFVLQMDQDSQPNSDMVAKLLEAYFYLQSKDYKVGLIGPQDHDIRTKEVAKPRVVRPKMLTPSYYMVNDTLSSGSLISREAYFDVGGMDEALFIDCVDFEYCWRLRKFGYIVVRNKEAVLAHQLGEGKKNWFFGLKFSVCKPIRHYYQFRNILSLIQRNYVPVYWRVSSLFKLFRDIAFLPLILDSGKERISYMLKGVVDALRCRLGRFEDYYSGLKKQK